jgi:signal peptide peptidase SppA
MEYERIVTQFLQGIWAIDENKLREIAAFLAAKANGAELPHYQARTAPPARVIEVAAGHSGKGARAAVAILPIYGTIVHRANLATDFSGGTSLEKATQQLRSFVADPSVGSIVLDVDSLGGSVYGLEEFADELRKANSIKQVTAVANPVAASAAYWILSQAGEAVVTPSGEVGSIGVLAVHEDVSKFLETRGVKTTMIKAGRYKGDTAPQFPLNDDARTYVQKNVDAYFDKFVSAVSRGRDVSSKEVRNGFGEGRMVLAAGALKMNMIDRVATLDDTIARIASSPSGLSAADERRRRLYRADTPTAISRLSVEDECRRNAMKYR